mgnify:CR=1 FL=1|jgi:hypothetical protein
MKAIKHSLNFITEVDESNPTAKKILQLTEAQQIFMLEQLIKEVLTPRLQPILDEINKGKSWATLKVGE